MMDPSENPAVAMLKRCRDQFQVYGDFHMAKPVPQVEKASINYRLVAEINEVLLTAAPPRLVAVDEPEFTRELGPLSVMPKTPAG